MKALVKHLIENNIDEIVSKSLLNCHVRGVHSIMLLECPEKTIRLYISMPDSEMYKNQPCNIKNGLSVAFHPHHCNLTIECIKGFIWNTLVKEVDIGYSVTKYIYKSKIKEGNMAFLKLKDTNVYFDKCTLLGAGNSISMLANEIHTVGCLKDAICAWFVYEWKEDKDYKPYCYTNVDPNKQVSEDLYIKPTKRQVIELLKKVDLLS